VARGSLSGYLYQAQSRETQIGGYCQRRTPIGEYQARVRGTVASVVSRQIIRAGVRVVHPVVTDGSALIPATG